MKRTNLTEEKTTKILSNYLGSYQLGSLIRHFKLNSNYLKQAKKLAQQILSTPAIGKAEKDAVVKLHYRAFNCDCYVTELDPITKTVSGYFCREDKDKKVSGMFTNSSLYELLCPNDIVWDLDWQECSLSEIINFIENSDF